MTATVVPLHDPIAHARSVRDRLWNPQNARQSSELDIASGNELRKRRALELQQREEAERAEADFRRETALDDLIRQELADHATAKTIAHKILAEDNKPAVKFDPEPPVLDPNSRTPFIRDIVRACAAHYEISILLLMSRRRLKKAVRARMVAYYLCHELTAKSMAEIGRRLSDRDHTTILHGWDKIGSELHHNKQLAADIAAIKKLINPSES